MKYILFVITILSFSINSYSADVYWSGRLEGSQINSGNLHIEDGNFSGLLSGSFVDVDSYGYIRLGISERLNGAYTASSNAVSVQVKITPFNNSGVQQTSFNQTLDILYSSVGTSGTTEIDASDYRMQGVHKFKIDVLSVTGTLVDYVYLEAGFWAERYYLFSSIYVPSIAPKMVKYNSDGSVNLSCVSTTQTCTDTDEIYLQWDYVQGAEYYDLEWTWVDNYSDLGLTSVTAMGSISLTDDDFKNNSTRIRTSDQFYRIPQIFSKGYLIYRVRGIGRWMDAPTKDLYGKWSSDNGQSKVSVSSWPNVVTITAEHENKKNWQYQATYAEQGKKKEVTQYFDGSLRGRQTVTRINSQNQSVVGETIYDNEGRGVIQVLPVPQDNPAIKYYPNMSTEQQGTPYSHKQFDWESSSANCDVVGSDPLGTGVGTATGAGKYYSSSAHTSETDWQQYVPEANGYAFTQVEYTPDNTGRIRNQSGVGANHKIGSGHETYYYYLQPSQEELNRLFGYKVGYKSRYKKNMVVDANGQISVSYLDAQGRVIATGLAGDNGTAFTSLNSEVSGNHIQTTTDLLNKLNASDVNTELDDNKLSSTGRFGAINDELKLETQLGVVKDGSSYVFDYTILSGVYDESCNDNGDGVAYRYVYDLSLSLRDDCGVEYFDTTFTEVGIEQIDALTGAFRYWTDTRILDKGSYTLYKSLRVNEQSLNNYKAHYLSDANACLLPSDNFSASISTDCGTTCEECAAGLGTIGDFLTQTELELGTSLTASEITSYTNIYNDLKAECLAPCKLLTSCDAYRASLLADLHPLGQYGLSSTDALSVFNVSNSLSGNWKSGTVTYYDEFGNPALIEAFVDGSGYSLTDPTSTGSGVPVMISPKQLTSVAEFMSVFQSSWAESLLPFHPEYVLYDYATDICTIQYNVPLLPSGTLALSSDEFDGVAQSITEYASAQSNSYGIDFLSGANALYSIDPYFNTSYSIHTYTNGGNLTGLKNALMLEALGNYQGSGLTMLAFAAKTVKCGNDYTTSGCSYPTAWSGVSGLASVSERNAIWSMYRSYYQSTKSKINQYLMDLYGFHASPGIYNGSIGSAGVGVGILSAFSGSTNYGTMASNVFNAWGGSPVYLNFPLLLAGSGYDSKVARIVRVDGLYNPSLPSSAMMAQGSASADYAQWESTGLCPLTVDVEHLLHALGSTDRLNLVTSMGALPELTPDLFAALNGSAPIVGSTMNVTGVTSTTNVILTFSNAPSGTTLTIPNLTNGSSTLPWNTYKTAWWIYSVSHSYPTATAGQVKVLIRAGASPTTANEYVVTYTLNRAGSGLNVNGCQAANNASSQNDPDCHKEQQLEAALSLFLQRIILNGQFYLTSGTAVGGMSEYNNTLIEEVIGTDAANWYGPNVNGLFSITGTSNNSLAIDINGTVPSGITMLTSVDIVGSDIYLQFMSSTGLVTVSAVYTYEQNNQKPLSLPLNCNCLSVQSATEEFFEYLLAQVTIACGTNPWSLQALAPYLGIANPRIQTFSAPLSGNMSVVLKSADDSCADPSQTCRLSLSWTGTTPTDLTGIVFTGTAFTATGVGTNITGQISCVQTTLPCDGCVPQAQEPISCTDKYTVYYNRMDDYMVGLSSEELAVFNAEYLVSNVDFCARGYAYIADAYVQYLNGLSITSPLNVNYLSIAEFGSTPLGYSSTLLSPVVSAYVAATTLSNPTSATYIPWNTYVLDVYMVANPGICPADLPQITIPDLVADVYPCDQWENNVSAVNAQNQHDIYLDQMGDAFVQAYIEGAMQSVVETFKERHLDKEFHYTLYYYDRAGNLIETVPPLGVQRFEYDAAGTPLVNPSNLITPATQAQINAKRQGQPDDFANSNYAPEHTYTTNYSYNSLNQLVNQTTPDGGLSRFAYDKLGRLVMSQNAKQLGVNQYSYTKYDALGRVIEVGEMTLSGYTINSKGRLELAGVESDAVNASNFPDNLSMVREEVTRTIYDELGSITVDVLTTAPSTYTPSTISSIFGSTYNWDNTRNRIVGVVYQQTYAASISSYESGIFYDYDVHGNVVHLIQINNDANLKPLNQHIKHLEYTYDLVSGNVHKVVYQKGQQDQFMHRYNYDADNRITIAETSNDGVYWEKDAKYFYYDHGPLARTEIGEKKVQAQDYAYTIQGWLKTVNGEEISATTMMGTDGAPTSSTNLNHMGAKDVYGYSLSYYNNDYVSANTSMLTYSNSGTPNLGASLHNGNIRSMYTALSKLNETSVGTHQTNYTYDQLNRLISMQGYNRQVGQGAMVSGYSSAYTYDANGNIKTADRFAHNGVTSLKMDEFVYDYLSNTNQLTRVDDLASLSSNFVEDIDDQGIDNYDYDAIGQLTQDDAEGITDIGWTVTNKVEDIYYGTTKHIHFDYDPMGNRIAKHVILASGTESTYYTLDAQGNQMSVYTRRPIDNKLYLSEQNIYGSSRVGQEQMHTEMVLNPTTNGSSYATKLIMGDKRYELTNHLGNVLEVVTDRKLASNGGSGSIVSYYTADVVSYSDYEPFGMALHGKNDGTGTRFGFQGQEVDPEIKGEGNSVNYKFRMHDPRIGRFFAVDPLAAKFSWNSPYAFSENKVIAWGELEGLECYYKANGRFVGQVGDNTDVRIINQGNVKEGAKFVKWAMHQISINGKWIEENKTAAMENSYSLGVSNETFLEASSVALGESSVGYGVISKEEMNSIAFIYINKNKTAYALKKDGATTFRNTNAYDRNKNKSYTTAISATIDAYNGIDNSNGATAWDGADQGVISGTQNKEQGYSSHAFQIGWTIHSKHYKSWKKAIEGAGLTFKAKQNDAAEGASGQEYNKGLYRYESTAQHGLSIFFKDRGTGKKAETPVKD